MKQLYNLVEKLVILGGTFDPVHNGHMQMAARLYAIFNCKVTFIPTGIPPYKAPPQATSEQRLEMLKLAIANNPNYQIDTREITADHYYYSHKTLTELRTVVGDKIPIFYIIGGDSLLTLHTWHYWKDLFDLANLVIANRSGYDLTKFDSPDLAQEFERRKTESLIDLSPSSGKIYLLNYTPQNVSSTFIRRQIQQHQDIYGLVPLAVAEYIQQQHLYNNLLQ